MPTKQISISLENVPGKFSEVLDYLSENEINIIGLSVADTSDISIVRLVVNLPEKAANILRSYGYSVKVAEVLAVQTPNHPGGLDTILNPLREFSININYLYTCQRTGEKTVFIMGVDKMAEAIQVLRKNSVSIYDNEMLKL